MNYQKIDAALASRLEDITDEKISIIVYSLNEIISESFRFSGLTGRFPSYVYYADLTKQEISELSYQDHILRLNNPYHLHPTSK